MMLMYKLTVFNTFKLGQVQVWAKFHYNWASFVQKQKCIGDKNIYAEVMDLL